MGLAASQARFLGITARKSNIEYEGQQVNQQRTALAEEVNALYNKLLALELPVAPDTTKFYETNYSFEVSGAETEKNGSYLIKSYYENGDGTYTVNAMRSYKKQVAEATLLGPDWSIVTNADDNTVSLVNSKTKESYPLTKSENPDAVINKINETNEENPLENVTELYAYSIDNTLHYLPIYPEGQESSDLWSYCIADKVVEEPVSWENAVLKFDANGRMSSFSAEELGNNFGVSTQRTYDTEGYDEALRDYTMSKDEYDKIVADLNAQTESLQQEDKILELRLNQIDTEQNELQTELEAVKAVLDKNIENTFKTFA